ncbi:MAG: ribonuclease D [Capsulimonadales bacterium]|nr:ribonuclease D [Capsulimonadales bacterium]
MPHCPPQAISHSEDTKISARYVSDRSSLESVCLEFRNALANDSRLALDTEFIRERTYHPVLEIIQVSADGGRLIALIDVPAVDRFDLGPLGDILRDPSVVKIVHAGGQDMEILAHRLGQPPQNVYDTQIAAAFAGYSLQTGYGPLVQSVLGVKLSKDEGFADWSRRPLTPAMRDYAENDVRYLHALQTKLASLLDRRGRTEWAAELMQRMVTQAAETPAQETLYERVGGKNVLDGRGLAVLRELAIWRDLEARRRDKPRRSVVKDDFLIEVARRVPQTASEVLALRSAPQNLGEKAAEALVGCVLRGLALPPELRPQPDAPLGLDEAGAVLVELLSAVVRVKAVQENLPPSLLASGDDLRFLAANRKCEGKWPTELFSGWRGAILGNDLRAAMEGRLAIRWDNKKGNVALFAIPQE